MKKKYIHCCRHPRTRSEKRANQDYKYVRGRRSPHNLVDTYDDIFSCVQKTWKVKRTHQYHCDGRGERHEIILDDKISWATRWDLKEYCEDHDIPYKIEHIYEPHFYTRIIRTERKPWYTVKTYINIYRWIKQENGKWEKTWVMSRHSGYRTFYHDVPLLIPKVVTYKSRRHVGTKFIWWYDKDIGIERILAKRQF